MILYRLFFLLFCSLNSVNLYATLDLNWEYNNSGPTRWPILLNFVVVEENSLQ